jgi:hypothetical protein
MDDNSLIDRSWPVAGLVNDWREWLRDGNSSKTDRLVKLHLKIIPAVMLTLSNRLRKRSAAISAGRTSATTITLTNGTRLN